ncbi:unnamed protein product, partial [Amoebophrya sp. A120]|eukprot:GSA120T00021373001.1
MTVIDQLTPGTLVWVPDAEEVWVAGEVCENTSSTGGAAGGGSNVSGGAASEQQLTLSVRIGEKSDEPRVLKRNEIVHLRNIDPKEPQRDIDSSDIEDLVHLSHLHEPALLHVLQERFANDQIYTFTGAILLAVNPFKQIPNLYSPELMHSYLTYEPYVVEVEPSHLGSHGSSDVPR